jgi:hypothetical protein
MPSIVRNRLPLLIAAAGVIATGTRAPAAQTKPTPTATPATTVAVNPDAPAVTAFMDRVNQYVALHKKLEATLPNLSKEATPEQITKREQSLGGLIQSARANARRGDIFTPEMTAIVKRVMNLVFGGPEGQKLRSSIMDENVAELPLKVNQRFPSAIPLATMPPAVLKALPELPEEMQYRFVATQFVLLDPHANVVADFIPGVIPIK